ncbi:MAG: SDR family oxidoreductase [Pseudobdellovibrio sp.]
MILKKQTVLITGASSGIGAEIAKKFAREGYDLLLCGRDEARLKKVQSECEDVKSAVLVFDLAEVKQSATYIEKKIAQFSPVTVLVNNAGLYIPGTFEGTSDEDWTTQFQVNLLSAVQLTKILWPEFKKNGKGSVLNISSTLGVKPTPFAGAYSATKAAMINWTLSLAQEGGPLGIRANCICPGIIDTPIHPFHSLNAEDKKKATDLTSSYQLLNFMGQPVDVAESAYLLASDLSKFTTGSILHIDGGINIK